MTNLDYDMYLDATSDAERRAVVRDAAVASQKRLALQGDVLFEEGRWLS